jgi:hypothetical protein
VLFSFDFLFLYGYVPADGTVPVKRGFVEIDANLQFSFAVVAVEQFQQSLMSGFDAEKNVFDFFGGNIVVPFLQFSIYLVYSCLCVLDKGIGFDGVRRSSCCPARFHVPVFGIYVAFHPETRFPAINGYPAKKRD